MPYMRVTSLTTEIKLEYVIVPNYLDDTALTEELNIMTSFGAGLLLAQHSLDVYRGLAKVTAQKFKRIIDGDIFGGIIVTIVSKDREIAEEVFQEYEKSVKKLFSSLGRPCPRFITEEDKNIEYI